MSTRNYRTDRRGFLKDAAIASIAGIGCLTVGGIGEALARTNPMRRSIVPLSPGGPARPFHMVTLGDSIMWGQGLRDGDKFSTKVQRWLESQLGGRQIVPHNYSH